MNLNTLYKKLTNGKYIIGLLIGFLGILNFCIGDGIYLEEIYSEILTGSYWHEYTNYNENFQYDLICYRNISCPSENIIISFNGYDQGGYTSWLDDGLNGGGLGICTSEGETRLSKTNSNCSIGVYGYVYTGVDTNFCVGNGLCPNECGSGEELTGTNRSNLFINNIQYNSAPTIKITIPEEIQRDENTDEEETNIDVIGYGYDQDKMQQMVNTQYYKPTAEEMSDLIGKIADFLPLIAVALLILRIWRVIKKVFRF